MVTLAVLGCVLFSRCGFCVSLDEAEHEPVAEIPTRWSGNRDAPPPALAR